MELIDRDALIDKSYWHGEMPTYDNPFPNGHDAVDVEDIETAPTIDAVPVVHGHWNKIANNNCGVVYGCQCSECGEECYFPDWVIDEDDEDSYIAMMHYCYNCGAKMDGAE